MTHETKFGLKPKPFVNLEKYPKHKMTKHEKHESREGVYGEYDEDVREHDRKHPQHGCVKKVSLWTIHGKGK